MNSTEKSPTPGTPGGAAAGFLVRHAALWLVPLALMLGLLLIEGVLRLIPSLLPSDAQQHLLWIHQTKPTSVGDPYLGFVYPPYYRTRITSLDFDFTVESDEHGFRNRSPWPAHAEVVIVGDSMAYGYGLEESEAWPTLIDEALPGIRVINLGMPGAVPQQYARYFERFGLGLRPKVLIFTIFPGNDVVEAADFERWLAAGSPGNYNVWRAFGDDAPPRLTTLTDRSYLLLALRSVRRSLAHGFSGTTTELPGGARLRLAPNLYAAALNRNHPGDPGFDAIVAAVRETQDRAQAIGCKLVVLFIPTKEDVYLPLQDAPLLGLIEPLKSIIARDKDTLVLDVTDLFREHAARGEQLYYETDGHPNAEGNRLLSEYVGRYLLDYALEPGTENANQPVAQPERDFAR